MRKGCFSFWILVFFQGLTDIKTCWGLSVPPLNRKFEKATTSYVLWQLWCGAVKMLCDGKGICSPFTKKRSTYRWYLCVKYEECLSCYLSVAVKDMQKHREECHVRYFLTLIPAPMERQYLWMYNSEFINLYSVQNTNFW